MELNRICNRCDRKEEHPKHNNICKKCVTQLYRRTKIGMIKKIYGTQKENSKKRKHNPPEYNLESFIKWFLRQNNFLELYVDWQKSGYNKWLRPSVDRLDNNEGYTFENIQLVTWKDNCNKSHINNSKNVLSIDEFGATEEYESIDSAALDNCTSSSSILCCCKGLNNTAGGLKWKFI